MLDETDFNDEIDQWARNNFINSEKMLEVNNVVNGILQIL